MITTAQSIADAGHAFADRARARMHAARRPATAAIGEAASFGTLTDSSYQAHHFLFGGATLPESGPETGTWAALAKTIGRCATWLIHQRRIRRDIEELLTRDDRMLADIGLSRSDIQYVAQHGRLPHREPDYACR